MPNLWCDLCGCNNFGLEADVIISRERQSRMAHQSSYRLILKMIVLHGCTNEDQCSSPFRPILVPPHCLVANFPSSRQGVLEQIPSIIQL
jgi:hypothetical protein